MSSFTEWLDGADNRSRSHHGRVGVRGGKTWASRPPAPRVEPAAAHAPEVGRKGGQLMPRKPIGRGATSEPAQSGNETRDQLINRLLDPTLTLEETAQVLNVCPTTVRRYTNRGNLPHFRTAGNQRRFRLSEVLAFQRAQEGVSTGNLGIVDTKSMGQSGHSGRQGGLAH